MISFSYLLALAASTAVVVNSQSTTQICSAANPCQNGGICENTFRGGEPYELCNCEKAFDKDGFQYEGLYCQKKSPVKNNNNIVFNDAVVDDDQQYGDDGVDDSNDDEESGQISVEDEECSAKRSCQNGGTCEVRFLADAVLHRVCNCKKAMDRYGFKYEGKYCDEKISDKDNDNNNAAGVAVVDDDQQYGDDGVDDSNNDEESGQINIEEDECSAKRPCQNGGTCQVLYLVDDAVLHRACNCKKAMDRYGFKYEGKYCDEKISDKDNDNNNATGVAVIDDDQQYGDDGVDDSDDDEEVSNNGNIITDECNNNDKKCMNGGICESISIKDDTNKVVKLCNCDDTKDKNGKMFTGIFCQNVMLDNDDDKDDDAVDNDDDANNSNNLDFKCDVDTLCYNGGVCRNSKCFCQNGFTGRLCENASSSSSSSSSKGDSHCSNGTICYNDGICVNNKCTCNNGFTGRFCDIHDNNFNDDNNNDDNETEITIIDCNGDGFFCFNGGICAGLNKCSCQNGFIGTHCEDPIPDFENIDEVVEEEEREKTVDCGNGFSCLNQGVCAGRDKCSCQNGFIGTHCEDPIPDFENIDEVVKEENKVNQSHCDDFYHCFNGGTCSGNRCECTNGFKGEFCERIATSSSSNNDNDAKIKFATQNNNIFPTTFNSNGHRFSKGSIVFFIFSLTFVIVASILLVVAYGRSTINANNNKDMLEVLTIETLPGSSTTEYKDKPDYEEFKAVVELI